jgi:BASS family bile acid:Na+ symporter
MKCWMAMRKGLLLNQFLEKRMIMVMGFAIVAGAVFHNQMVGLKPLVPYLFAYMTFVVAINCGARDFQNAIKAPLPLLTIFGALHIVLPILAAFLARTFLPDNPLLQAGVILGTAAPIGVSSSIWINISGGDNALGLTAVVADTILAPLIIPAIMLLTVDRRVNFDVPQLVIGLAWMIMIPTIIGMIIHDRTGGKINRQLKFITGPTSKLFLAIVVASNLAVAWDSLHLLKTSLIPVFLLTFTMGGSGFLLGYLVAKLTRQTPRLVNTYIFLVGMRNITAGLVMALKYFPELTAIPVVFAIVFQQPMAALAHRFLVERRIER